MFTLIALALLVDSGRQLCGEKPRMLLLIKTSLVPFLIESVDAPLSGFLVVSMSCLVSKPTILLRRKMYSFRQSNAHSLLFSLYALYSNFSIGFPFLECFRTI